MIIKPLDLIPDPLALNLTFEPGAVDYTPDLRQVGPLHFEALADRIEEHRGPHEIVEDIRVRGKFDGRFEHLCARCLEPTSQQLHVNVDLIFRPAGSDADQPERAITEAETEIGYYGQSGLLVEDVIREQVLLNLPERSLCRPDCQGLCPQCGANRNDAPCNCRASQSDSRWQALASVASKG